MKVFSGGFALIKTERTNHKRTASTNERCCYFKTEASWRKSRLKTAALCPVFEDTCSDKITDII